MNHGKPPPSERQEDGVSQGHNSSATNETVPGGAVTGEEEWRGEGELRLSDGRRAKRARVKRGRRSSCGRARRWRGNLVNLTNKGMSPNDLLDTMQRKHEGIREYTNAKLEEMAGKNSEEQGAERVEVAKVKERRTVMNTKVPTHGTWKKNEREDEDVTRRRCAGGQLYGKRRLTGGREREGGGSEMNPEEDKTCR